MGTECTVCCEKFNLKNHKKAVCPFCDFDVCRTCVQKVLLDSVKDPHCMNCSKGWSRDVLDSVCTKVFRDGAYRQHRATLLMEREKCLLPEAIPEVEKIKRIRNIDELINKSTREMRMIQDTIRHLQQTQDAIKNQPTSTEKRVFVRKCPVSACRGFLSTRWKCEVCENNICPDCNEIKHADTAHVCDPNNVETVKLLKKDTKPCPNCGTMIFKISGCSQMWCPDCHTAFDWNTMRVERGVIHNPHFYEFNRRAGRQAREAGDIPCGGMPTVEEFHRFFLGSKYMRSDVSRLPIESQNVFRIHQLVLHIEHWELTRNYADHRPIDTMHLRVKYLMNEISEEFMKNTLQRDEKTREKTRDIADVLRMFCNVMTDMFRQLMLNEVSQKHVLKIYDELRLYMTENFTAIHKRYNCVTPLFTENFRMTTTNYKKSKTAQTV